MTTAFVIAAVCILIAGLFAVIVERTNERDAARRRVAALSAELAARPPRLRVVRGVSDDEWFGRLYDEKGGLR